MIERHSDFWGKLNALWLNSLKDVKKALKGLNPALSGMIGCALKAAMSGESKMVHDPFSVAKARINELEQELVLLKAFVQTYQTLAEKGAEGLRESKRNLTYVICNVGEEVPDSIAHYKAWANHIPDVLVNNMKREDVWSQRDGPIPSPLGEIREAAYKALKAVDGGPLQLHELTRRVMDMGVIIGGKKPSHNLSAKLGGDGRFQSIPQLGWTLRDPKEPTQGRGAPEGAPDQNEWDFVPSSSGSSDAFR